MKRYVIFGIIMFGINNINGGGIMILYLVVICGVLLYINTLHAIKRIVEKKEIAFNMLVGSCFVMVIIWCIFVIYG